MHREVVTMMNNVSHLAFFVFFYLKWNFRISTFQGELSLQQFLGDLKQRGASQKFFFSATLEHKALLDTGADVTLMSPELFFELQAIAHQSNRNLELQHCSLEVKPYAPTGTTLTTRAVIYFTIGSMNLVHPVYLFPFDSTPLFIGKDLLNRFEPLIDFKCLKILAQVRKPLPIDFSQITRFSATNLTQTP